MVYYSKVKISKTSLKKRHLWIFSQIRKGFNLGDEKIPGRGSDSYSDLEVYESMPVRKSHIGYNMEETWGAYAKWNNSYRGRQVLYGSHKHVESNWSITQN